MQMIKKPTAATGISTESTKESSPTASDKGMALLSGTTERSLKDSGKTEPKTVLESGNHQKEISTKETGFSIDNMANASINIG